MMILVTIVHVLVSLILIGVVLLQTGKRADLAGAFGGGGSQTAFGPRGAANVLSTITTWAAVMFMVTSLSLAIMSARSSGAGGSVLDGVDSTPATAPAVPGAADDADAGAPAPLGEGEAPATLPPLDDGGAPASLPPLDEGEAPAGVIDATEDPNDN